MAERIVKTPPIERKKIDGAAISNHDLEGHFSITTIDQEQHIVRLDVGGCPVTLICSPKSNPKPYQRVKAVLLDMIAGSIPQK